MLGDNNTIMDKTVKDCACRHDDLPTKDPTMMQIIN